MHNHPNKSLSSVDTSRSLTLERSEDDQPITRASESPIPTEQYTPSEHEIRGPNITAEEGGLARGGSISSLRSVDPNSITSLTTEPILEKPDGGECVSVPRKSEGQAAASPDKGEFFRKAMRELGYLDISAWTEHGHRPFGPKLSFSADENGRYIDDWGESLSQALAQPSFYRGGSLSLNRSTNPHETGVSHHHDSGYGEGSCHL
jgi:hypothetical protein